MERRRACFLGLGMVLFGLFDRLLWLVWALTVKFDEEESKVKKKRRRNEESFFLFFSRTTEYNQPLFSSLATVLSCSSFVTASSIYRKVAAAGVKRGWRLLITRRNRDFALFGSTPLFLPNEPTTRMEEHGAGRTTITSVTHRVFSAPTNGCKNRVNPGPIFFSLQQQLAWQWGWDGQGNEWAKIQITL